MIVVLILLLHVVVTALSTPISFEVSANFKINPCIASVSTHPCMYFSIHPSTHASTHTCMHACTTTHKGTSLESFLRSSATLMLYGTCCIRIREDCLTG